MTNVKYMNQKYVPGTSRGPRRAATLLAQMADLERGDRIRELREQLHLTQPAVADKVHVTLRAYQEWEAGGGIQWENAKRLAKALRATPDFIMSGVRTETPDLSLSQLDRVEQKLDAILRLLNPQQPTAGLPEPPADLGHLASTDQPTKPADLREANRPAGGKRRHAGE